MTPPVILSASGDYLVAAKGTRTGPSGTLFVITGSSWTGSLVFKVNSAYEKDAASLATIAYESRATGRTVAAGTAITSDAVIVVGQPGMDVYVSYTHTAGSVSIQAIPAPDFEELPNRVTGIYYGIADDGTPTVLFHNYKGGSSLGRNAFFGQNSGNFTMAGGNSEQGSENSGFGANTLANLTTGYDNTAVGKDALLSVTSGYDNTGIGEASGSSLTTGHENTALGEYSLKSTTTGSLNTALGAYAGLTGTEANGNVTGSNNTWVGAKSGPASTTQISNTIGLGANVVVTASNTAVIGDVNITNVYFGSESAAAQIRAAAALTSYVNMSGSALNRTAVTLNGGGSNYGTIQVSSGSSTWALGYQASVSTTIGTPVLSWNDAKQVTLGGVAAAATTATSVTKAIAAIADNTYTDVFTVTVPNAAHAATLLVTLQGALGAGGAIGAGEAAAGITYAFTVVRTAGVNAVVATSSAYGSSGPAAVAGADTVTVTGQASAVSGAVGAANTFTIQVRVTKGGGSSANHTCVAHARLLNANATGVTIA